MVQAFSSMGKGRSDMEQFSIIINMHVITNSSYQDLLQTIHSASKSAGNNSLDEVRKEARKAYKEIPPDSHDNDDVIDNSESYDGSWHERSYFSLWGRMCH